MSTSGKRCLCLSGLLLLSGALITALLWAWRSQSQAQLWLALEKPEGFIGIEIRHPISGAVLPANMPAPVVLWNTNIAGIQAWGAAFKAGTERRWFGHIQPMWRPGEAEWDRLKAAAKGQPIELIVAGFTDHRGSSLRACGSVRFALDPESVESPLFYREVNLPFIDAVKDPSRIRWRFGGLGRGTLPPVVLEHLPVCGNCHSFSQHGEYLAMDVDYANSKASYVITKTMPQMRLSTSDIITWDHFRREDGQTTFGLLSQISPDGRFVLSTVKDRSIFVPRSNLAFSQLFFPLKGIIAVYDRQTKQFSALPGADDPAYVQSNPTWSPDGQWILFARRPAAELKSSPDSESVLVSEQDCEAFLARHREFRYDLYRIPFNAGRGGIAEPLRGASGNGRSNFFPKYSPDGRWIVFCQAANYMLLQPDSELFILPAEGGEARRLDCNLSRMNSWHSWSPDGKWLVFSSKAHSDYTQLYLARIHPAGEASPPVWLAHLVEPGRAANIPEFVALPPDAIVKIKEEFLDDYSFCRAGDEFLKAGDLDRAIAKFRTALSLNPDNVMAHQRLGFLLHHGKRQFDEARQHLQTALRLDPHAPVTLFALGTALMETGDYTNAIKHLTEAARWVTPGTRYDISDLNRELPEALQYELGVAYAQAGDLDNAARHYSEALRLRPDYPEAHNNLGNLLLRAGRLAEADEHFTQALHLKPAYSQAHNNLGIVRQQQGRRPEALASFKKAVEADHNNWQAHFNLANAYLADGSRELAILELRETLRLQPSFVPAQQVLARAQGSSPTTGSSASRTESGAPSDPLGVR